MAKKRKRNNSRQEEDLVQVDIYYLPREQAEMYTVLREVVAEETTEWLRERFERVERIKDTDEGEALAAYNREGKEVIRFYLNPKNISEAQIARDKDQLNRYLETHLL